MLIEIILETVELLVDEDTVYDQTFFIRASIVPVGFDTFESRYNLLTVAYSGALLLGAGR